MPILLKMNLKCNFDCKYCYQRPIRPEEEVIDYKAVDATIMRLWTEAGGEKQVDKDGKYTGTSITLHGGEPTILPIQDIEHYLELAYKLTGKSGIQTNCYNITDEMISLFKKYKTIVGVSIDGPYPLSQFRGFGSASQREACTEQSFKNIDRLHTEKIQMSVIAVIHKGNGLGKRREILKEWVKEMNNKGITGRLNICCSGNSDIDLTVDEAKEAYSDLYDFMLENGFDRWSPFKDIANSLKGEKEVVCTFRGCDPFCTASAISVLNDGSVGVCLRLYEDGKKYLRSDTTKPIRTEILKAGDCSGCKWWKYCNGGCSGLSTNWDWRNKDRYCEVYKCLFEKTENLFKTLKIKFPPQQPTPPKNKNEPKSHSDGIEHIDGSTRHLDGEG